MKCCLANTAENQVRAATAMSNKYHRELIVSIRAHARQLSQPDMEKLVRYIGTNKTLYAIGTDAQRKIIKEWTKKRTDLTQSQYTELLTSLCQGDSINGISVAGELLIFFPKLRRKVEPKYLDVWLNSVQGWAEVDSICQSKFSAADLLADWKEWKSLLTNLASNDNVNKKRASLVLLTKPVGDSADTRLADQAFSNIDKLKNEHEILITKAVSWLLRDLIKHNRQRVENYLKENMNTLPKIALRETNTKLLTGRKTPPSIAQRRPAAERLKNRRQLR